MTYRIFQNAEGFWFQCRSSLAVRHRPSATRQEAYTEHERDQLIADAKDCGFSYTVEEYD